MLNLSVLSHFAIKEIAMSDQIALQDQYAPELICFGCGPANEKGLQLKSFAEEIVPVNSRESL